MVKRAFRVDADYAAIKERMKEHDVKASCKYINSDDLSQFEDRIRTIIDNSIRTFQFNIEGSGGATTVADFANVMVSDAIQKHEEQAELTVLAMKEDIKLKFTSITNANENLVKVVKANESKIKLLKEKNTEIKNTLINNRQNNELIKGNIELQSKNFKEEVEKLTKDINKIRSLNRNQTLGDSTIILPSKAQKLKPPIFKADAKDKPMRYLRELKKYIDVLNIDSDEMILSIGQTLENTASAWFDIAQQSIRSIEDFKNKFKARFWNMDIQDDWARKVDYDHYNFGMKLSRLEYATYVWDFGQDLEREFTEQDLVRKIANHFD